MARTFIAKDRPYADIVNNVQARREHAVERKSYLTAYPDIRDRRYERLVFGVSARRIKRAQQKAETGVGVIGGKLERGIQAIYVIENCAEIDAAILRGAY